MYEWNEMEQLGYSTYYCSRQFNQLAGMTLRDYIWTRRISRIPLAIRQEVFSPYHYLIKGPDKMNKVHSGVFMRTVEVAWNFDPQWMGYNGIVVDCKQCYSYNGKLII